MTREQATALLRQTADAIVETVNEQPNGAPAGSMYAACMTVGMSLEMFEQITSALVRIGKIRKRGDLFYPA